MRKFYFLILIFLYFFVLALNISAQENFIKYDKNPLFFSFPEGYSEIRQIHIFYEKNLFKGLFSFKRSVDDNFNIFYGESWDGVSWEIKKKINTYKINSFTPRVFKRNDDVYILYFSTLENNLYKIYKLYCNADFNCSTSPQLVLTPEKPYESIGVFAGNHYLINNQHYLFYASWNGGFHINIAISTDGEKWQRCENNPILHSYDAPFLWQKKSDFYLFYHVYDSSGIKQAKITNLEGCNIEIKELGYILQPVKNYDLYHLIFPSIIETSTNLLIFYTGLGTEGWRLNLASTNPFQPLPSPTPIHNHPLILLPGLMASWNKEAILYNRAVGVFDWKILPFVKEYDGIINTLKNLDYVENQDFYVFPYDWRKSVDQSSEDLKTFIDTKISPNKKINLIGHSLGGLVGRIFTQKYKDRVNKLITVGSPHQGVVQVYKPLSAGEIDRENTFLWLAQKLVLMLNKTTLETDKETLRKKFPVALDLFPTFAFLKKENGQEIAPNNLSIKNNLLLSYNQNFFEIFPIFFAFYGEKGAETPSGYVVEPPNLIHQTLNNYPDGQPKSIYFDVGDYTILSKSANQDSDSEKLNFDHGEIITKKEAIQKILDKIGIDTRLAENKIKEGKKTKFSPSLIFLIKSSAKISLKKPDNQSIAEVDGIIFLDDAHSGNYQLQIQGVKKGKYTLIAAQITNDKDFWETKEGEITTDSPSSYIENYSFYFNNNLPTPIFPTPSPSPTPPALNQTITSNLTPTPLLNSSITPIAAVTNNQSSNNQSATNQALSVYNTSSSKLENNFKLKNKLLSKNISPTLTKKSASDHKGEILGAENKKNSKKSFLFSFVVILILITAVLLVFLKLKKPVANEGVEPPTSAM